jgi:flagellin-like hook-associated protein FlgL
VFITLGSSSQNILSNIGRFSDQFASGVRNISSGTKDPSDDPASISISERLKSAITETAQQMKNIRDRMGALEQQRSETLLKVDVMQRIRELAVAYGNSTLTESEKDQIQTQVDELSKLLSDKSSFSSGYVSDVKIKELDKVEISEIDVISEQTYGDEKSVVEFVIYRENSADTLVGLSGLLAGNETFLSAAMEGYSGSDELVFDAQSSMLVEKKNEEASLFDLSSESALSEIDKKLDQFAGSAAEISAKISGMEFRLDAMMNKQEGLNDHLSRLTDADLAQEMTDLVKAKLMMELGGQMLNLHRNIEKDTVLALISQM